MKELRKSPKRLNEVKQHGDSHLSSRSPEPREAKEPGDAPVLPSMAHTRTVMTNCLLMRAVLCDY